MKFHERLRIARKNAKMTQDELGKYFGITKGGISGWESGRRNPDPTEIKKLSEVLNVSTDWLVGLSAEPNDVFTPIKHSSPTRRAVIEYLIANNRIKSEESLTEKQSGIIDCVAKLLDLTF